MAENTLKDQKLVDMIDVFLKQILKKELERVFIELKKEFSLEILEQLDKEKDEIIAGIALNVFKFIDVREFADVLRIEIKTDSIKKSEFVGKIKKDGE